MKALAAKATPGPYTYRPLPQDDWGMVRDNADKKLVAIARAGRPLTESEKEEHCDKGSDPYRSNAVFFAACDPQTISSLIDEVLELRRASEDMAKALEHIVKYDRDEIRHTVEVDPAGNTYEIEEVDGRFAKVARPPLAAYRSLPEDQL